MVSNALTTIYRAGLFLYTVWRTSMYIHCSNNKCGCYYYFQTLILFISFKLLRHVYGIKRSRATLYTVHIVRRHARFLNDGNFNLLFKCIQSRIALPCHILWDRNKQIIWKLLCVALKQDRSHVFAFWNYKYVLN